jgi:hypothetical protein
VSDPVEIALITAAGVVVSGALSSIVIVLVKRLEVRVDGRLTDLLDLTKKASHAEGMLEGEKNGKEH